MRHHDGVEPQHTESGVKPPSNITATAKARSAGGTGRVSSAIGTLTVSPREAVLPEQPHVEPAGGDGIPATGLDFNQRS
jgi:hypothetical protein